MAVDLTKRMFSDAKADELIAAIEGLAGSGNSGMSDAAKAALINCFLKVAWVDDSGADLIQALTTALYGGDAPVDNRLVYELKNTDISNIAIDTGVPVFQLGENFTILARVTMNQWPAGKTSDGYILNHRDMSTGTIRLGVSKADNEIKFIGNVMYSDNYMNDISGYAGGTISANSSHEIVWMVRMSGTVVKKVLYIDGVKAISKEENISSQASGKTFTGNYFISGGTNNTSLSYTLPGTAKLIRIYNEALSTSEIGSIMGLDF